MPIAIVTDSTACLHPADAQRDGITVVPLKVVIGEETFTEGCGLTGDEIAEALKAKKPVTTSRPTPEELLEVYESLAAGGADEVVSIHLSAKVSGTLDAAMVAAKRASIPVTVVDSTTIGLATGFAAGRAARARDAGGASSSMAAAARSAGEASTTLLYVDSLEYLRRGGRVTTVGAFLGSALAVKPILAVRDGAVGPLERVRTASKAMARLEALIVAACAEAENGFDIGVQHLAAQDAAEQFAGRVASAIGRDEVAVDEISAVLGAHTGPGTVSVSLTPR
ncbi:MAG TPA: DegV family protein [Aeromicrobium sp.]|nr:DegV family protein [Aeromicrobium sp.]